MSNTEELLHSPLSVIHNVFSEFKSRASEAVLREGVDFGVKELYDYLLNDPHILEQVLYLFTYFKACTCVFVCVNL